MTPRDRTTLRRGLLAGAVAAAVVGVPLVVAAAADGSGLTGVAVLAGLAAGALAAAAWLLLAGILDVWSGTFPGRARLAVTAVVTLLALLGPYLVLAGLTALAAARR